MLTPEIVSSRVVSELARIQDERVRDVLRSHLVTPKLCLLDWDYGHPFPEFPEPRYPGYIVAEFLESGTGIALSEYGSQSHPWVLVRLDYLGFGMDSSWFANLEQAFRSSMACDIPAPPGYELD